MWNSQVIIMLLEGIRDTLYMTLASTLFGYIIGLPMGIVLTVTDKDGIRPNAAVYKVLDVISSLLRSIPFIILLIVLIPFTRFVVGRSCGLTATIVPLTIAAAPYIARMVESSLKEVDAGVIEAARSMGASDFQIVTKVMLVEARTSLIVGATISLGTIFRIFRDGRNRRRRRTGRYCHPLWLHQMADRYHGCHSGASGNFIPDFPDDRNEDCESAGSQKVAITNLHIFLSFKEDTIMKKKVLSTILAGVLALSAFAGCGSSTEESTDTSAATKEETPVAATEEAVSAENTESTDTAAEGGTIKVAASATPHAEILEEAKKILADEGWDLEIKIFDDYVMPNEVVESGEFDANYFQHIPYLREL